MRVLVVHNFYQQPGGEDTTRAAEVALLREYGHEVYEYLDSNDRIDQMSPLSVALQTFWSIPSYGHIREAIADFNPDVAHFHNTFPLISPAAYYACQGLGVPVVQTVHNFRLTCVTATFTRNGRICEDCLGKRLAWPGVRHRCYHDSLIHSAVVAGMLATHRCLGTWQHQVDAYIVATEFAKEKFIQAGLPVRRLFVKPNFILPDPGVRSTADGSYALSVGRLSPEKGLYTLLSAWQQLPDIPLKIVGDGPLKQALEEEARQWGLKQVEFVGHVAHATVLTLMKQARLLVFSSECYEGYPLTLIEAFACGLPVVASRLGAMAAIIRDGDTGLLITPKDANDLAAKVHWAWLRPGELSRIGKAAWVQYETENSPEKNYQMLMDIYGAAIQTKKARG